MKQFCWVLHGWERSLFLSYSFPSCLAYVSFVIKIASKVLNWTVYHKVFWACFAFVLFFPFSPKFQLMLTFSMFCIVKVAHCRACQIIIWNQIFCHHMENLLWTVLVSFAFVIHCALQRDYSYLFFARQGFGYSYSAATTCGVAVQFLLENLPWVLLGMADSQEEHRGLKEITQCQNRQWIHICE